jgi:DNA-binding LacI/PurR family transcriptional regulator
VINGPDEMKSSKERTDAYKEVMIKQRLKIDMSLVVSTDLSAESTRLALTNCFQQNQDHRYSCHQ